MVIFLFSMNSDGAVRGSVSTLPLMMIILWCILIWTMPLVTTINSGIIEQFSFLFGYF